MSNSRKTHVDDFIDGNYQSHQYARWILNHMRMPVALQLDFEPFMKDHKLFCTYEGQRYQVTFVSRMGWLRLERQNQLHDVYVDDCSDWSPNL